MRRCWSTVHGMIDRGRELVYAPSVKMLMSCANRDAFTKAFAPSIFYQATKTDRLEPGMYRMHTEMRVRVELQKTTTIRVPTREPSKVSNFRLADLQETNVVRTPGLAIRLQGHLSAKHASEVRLDGPVRWAEFDNQLCYAIGRISSWF